MKKRMLALSLSLILLLTMVMPLEASARPPWFDRFLDIVVADAAGALDGFVQTESLGGAIIGGIEGSVREGTEGGISGGGWQPDEAADESVGLHHNLGLNFYYDKGAPEERSAVLMEYLDQNRIPYDQREMQTYLRGLEPTLEEILRRIREGTTGPFNPNPGASDGDHEGEEGHGVVVSDRFVSNLEETLKILDGNADHPQQMLDEAVAFIINASLKETDEDLRDDIIDFGQDYNSTRSNKRENTVDLGGGEGGPLDYDRIKVTYEQQKSMGQPTDIILAWIFVDVLQHSAHYWSEVYCWGEGPTGNREQATDNGKLWCWGANFERVMLDPDADPDREDVFILVGDYLDPDDDGDAIPDTIEPEIEEEEQEAIEEEEQLPEAADKDRLVLTIDGDTARSGNAIKEMDTAPFIKDGRTLVPFRFIGEELGAEIGWIPETRMVTYHRETDKRRVSIEMIIGQNQASVNGEPVAVDRNPVVVPEIVNGRTVVPVRFISEALGFEVEWNQDTREVTIFEKTDG